MTPSELDIESIFRALYLADLEGQGDRGLEAYVELFPGHGAAITALHGRMSLGGEAPAQTTRSSIGLDTSVGARVGHYRIEGEIGQGGQAIVYRALDEKLGRPVALKLLLGASQRGEDGLRRFRREAEVCSRLDHPGICTVHDTGVQGGIPYIVMELIEGKNLSAWAVDPSASDDPGVSMFVFSDEDAAAEDDDSQSSTRSKPAGTMPDRQRIIELIEVFARAGEALAAAHDAGVIHRDIKPGNIMVKRDGQPVILDFGLAQDLDSDLHALTQTGDFFGTPAYMSPEQISAHRIRLDLRSDIFSLGVSFYECLTLRRPFDSPTREGIYQAILTKEAASPRGLNQSIPRDVAVVVGKALEKDRDRRYQTAAEFAADLRRIQKHEPILARPANVGIRILRWTQRNRVLAGAIITLPLVILATLISTSLLAHEKELKRIEDERQGHRDALAKDIDELGRVIARNDISMILQPRILSRIDGHLGALGDEGHDFIRKQLSSSDWHERLAALAAIIHKGDSGSSSDLVRLCLEDDNQTVRIWSSQALMRMEGDQSNAALVRVYRESKDDPCRVNALFGLVFNDHPDAAILAADYMRNDSVSPFLRVVLAKNLMMLARADMKPVAEWLTQNLQPVQSEEWGSLVRHHAGLGEPENLEALRRIAADERLDELVRKEAQQAVKKIEGEVKPESAN